MSRKKSSPQRKLQVIVDPGSSQFKIFYLIDDKLVKYMAMGGEYISLPQKYSGSLPKLGSLGHPENNAWFQTEGSDEVHLVGNLAKQKNICLNLKRSKHDLLENRVIAIIGAIAMKNSLYKVFSLDLGILIPVNEIREIESVKDWRSNLKEKLNKFTFQGQEIKARVKRLDVKPEGFGVLLENKTMIKDSGTAVVMAGHRNTSCLFINDRSIQIGNSGTSMLGFSQVIKKLKSEISYLSEDSILASLTTACNTVSTYLPEHGIRYKAEQVKIDFAALIPPSFSRDRNEEVKRLSSIYDRALEEYWLSLINWLEQTLPSANQVDYFVFCGGTSLLLEEKIPSLLEAYNASLLAQNGDDDDTIHRYLFYRKSPELNKFNNRNLSTRLKDAWGFFLFFTGYDYKNKIINESTGEPKS